MRVFVPIEDSPPDAGAVLVPYRQGLPCEHGLRGGFSRDAAGWLEFGAANAADGTRLREARAETQSA